MAGSNLRVHSYCSSNQRTLRTLSRQRSREHNNRSSSPLYVCVWGGGRFCLPQMATQSWAKLRMDEYCKAVFLSLELEKAQLPWCVTNQILSKMLPIEMVYNLFHCSDREFVLEVQMVSSFCQPNTARVLQKREPQLTHQLGLWVGLCCIFLVSD